MLILFKQTKGKNWNGWDIVVDAVVDGRVVAGRKVGQILQLRFPDGFSHTAVEFAHRVSKFVREGAEIFADELTNA